MSATNEINQIESIHDVQNGTDNAKLSDKAQVITDMVPITPDGPLSGDIYVLRHGFLWKLKAWMSNGNKRRINQNNSLLPDGFCPRCDELASTDLERLRSLRMENSQSVFIRLAETDTRCKGCRFFAHCKPASIPGKQTTDYFLVSLAAETLDLRPVQSRLCIVTNRLTDPVQGTGLQVQGIDFHDRYSVQYCMFPTDTITLCSQDEIRHLPFGHDEYESISQWLRNCMNDHSKECSQTSVRNTLTLYCIDCQEKRVVPIPHSAKYFALSYVWGDTTAPDNDGSLSEAPPIIRDAMTATLRLRFRYLWVDRYCINQHDSAQKHQQIANMGNIYAGATLTFIAAGDTDYAVGLPGVSSCRCNSAAEFQLGPYSFLRFFSDPKAEIGGSKWATRGWTYQEAVMSVRKLVFTSNGFYTQCNIQHSFGTSHPINRQTIISNRRNTEMWRRFYLEPIPVIATSLVFPVTYSDQQILHSESALGKYFDHISQYIRRQLSYESDRLNAIQGVLNEFRSNKVPLFQIFGVPFNPASECTINATLFWCMQSHCVQRRTDFPSWSWLGWQYIGEIPHPSVLLCDLKDLVPGERYPKYSAGPRLSLDKHTASINVEFLGGGLLNLTEAHQSNIPLDTALPREARIMPHLVIHGVITPFMFERDDWAEWVHVGALCKPFDKKSSLFPFKFRMWLDVSDAQDQDGSSQEQVRELILGRFGTVIRVLILRENGCAWTRIGIGQYSWRDSTTNEIPWSYGIEAVKNAYFKVLNRHRKRTIQLM